MKDYIDEIKFTFTVSNFEFLMNLTQLDMKMENLMNHNPDKASNLLKDLAFVYKENNPQNNKINELLDSYGQKTLANYYAILEGRTNSLIGGNKEDNILSGTTNIDYIVGQVGNDQLIGHDGGEGNDKLYGGNNG